MCTGCRSFHSLSTFPFWDCTHTFMKTRRAHLPHSSSFLLPSMSSRSSSPSESLLRSLAVGRSCSPHWPSESLGRDILQGSHHGWGRRYLAGIRKLTMQSPGLDDLPEKWSITSKWWAGSEAHWRWRSMGWSGRKSFVLSSCLRVVDTPRTSLPSNSNTPPWRARKCLTSSVRLSSSCSFSPRRNPRLSCRIQRGITPAFRYFFLFFFFLFSFISICFFISLTNDIVLFTYNFDSSRMPPLHGEGVRTRLKAQGLCPMSTCHVSKWRMW